ncbi:hypothetical protein [Streptomyces sp. NPDC090025]|uniref:hypothetical protein n=1 Tax=Streptomyces sp. NPDC090025 TaxID=3365922 RepID=UPI00383677F3
MKFRRTLSLALSTAALIGAGLAGTGTAHAAYGCGGQLWTTVSSGVVRVELYRESADWCAVAVHVNGTYGTYFATSVQIEGSEGGLSILDSGNFRYYAGPTRYPRDGMPVRAIGWSSRTGTVQTRFTDVG